MPTLCQQSGNLHLVAGERSLPLKARVFFIKGSVTPQHLHYRLCGAVGRSTCAHRQSLGMLFAHRRHYFYAPSSRVTARAALIMAAIVDTPVPRAPLRAQLHSFIALSWQEKLNSPQIQAQLGVYRVHSIPLLSFSRAQVGTATPLLLLIPLQVNAGLIRLTTKVFLSYC